MSELRLVPPSWGRLLRERVRAAADPGRFGRGEELLRAGAVEGVRPRGGTLTGAVRGSGGSAYQAAVAVLPLAEHEVARLARAVAERPELLLDLLAQSGAGGSAAADALDRSAGVDVLPPVRTLLHAACTCPDPHEPCKHAVALALAGADLVERTPALWLALRGFPLEEVAGDLLPEGPAEPLQEHLEDFFTPLGPVPALAAPRRARPAVDTRDADLLRAVLRPDLPRLPRTSGAAVEQRVDAAVEALRALYAAFVREPGGR